MATVFKRQAEDGLWEVVSTGTGQVLNWYDTEAEANQGLIAFGDIGDISPTSTHTEGGIRCPKCDGECIRTVWVNTILRAVQLDITCMEPGCDYHIFEPWEVVEAKVETP